MNVLLITDLYPTNDERQGNDQTQAIKELIGASKIHGLNLVAVVRFKQFFQRKLSIKNLLLRRVGANIYDLPIVGYRSIFLSNYTRFLLNKLFGNAQIDIIVCHMSLSGLRFLKSFASTSSSKILVVHKSDLKLPYLSLCMGKFDSVFARSFAIKSELEQRFKLDEVKVMHSGVPEYFFNHQYREDLQEKVLSSSCKLIYAGELKALKNINSVIISVFDLIKAGFSITFDIYGVGPEEQNLKKLSKELGLESWVKFHGWIARSELPERFMSSDIFVMPSSPETFGLVYLEAMAAGCIILGHKNEGIDGVVKDGVNALMVDKAEPELISDRVKWFLALSKKNRFELNDESFSIAKMYTLESAAKNYVELMRQVIRRA